MRATTIISVLTVLVAACGGETGERKLENQETVIAKIRVYQDGRITWDGAATSLDDLPVALAQLKERAGAVWYFREDGGSEPHPNGMAVIQAIIEARLPISLSSEEDFSTVVLPDGTVKPREAE